jgi:hypothetical protein
MSGSQAVAGQRITAAWLNLLVPGPWIPWATITTGWANSAGNVPAQARKLNSVTVHVTASLVVTANATGALGTVVVGTLPPGLVPQTSYNGSYGIDGISGTGYFLNIRSDGSVHLFGLPQLTTAEVVGINAIIALDS